MTTMRVGLWLFVVLGLMSIFATGRAACHGWWDETAAGCLTVGVCWAFILMLSRCIYWEIQDRNRYTRL